MNTKMTSLPRLALVGAVAFATQITSGQSWQTVDDCVAGSAPWQAMFDPAGNLYVSGGWVLRKSSDGGSSWSTLTTLSMDHFMGAPMACDANGVLYGTGHGSSWMEVSRSLDGGLTWSDVDPDESTTLYALATDSQGNVFKAGSIAPGSMTNVWRVCKGTTNPDLSVTWTTVDSFVPGWARAMVSHPMGLFVLGQGRATVTQRKNTYSWPAWVVRRSLDDGATWSTVDAYVCSGMPQALGVDPSGTLYAVGIGDNNDWLVRQSSDGGRTWTTVDDWLPDKHHNTLAFAYGIASDPAGNVFVVGGTGWSWIVRMRPAGGTTWTTVDDFQYVTNARARGVVSDSAGNVYVVGSGSDGARSHWLVRKLTR